MSTICVYCGSSRGDHPVYTKIAADMGTEIARSGHVLAYGGGKVGLMGAVADAALAAGGQVIGIMPKFLVDREIAHTGLTELRVVDTMHARKEMLIRASDQMVALPGGWGTYDELAEAVTWAQLGLHAKPIGVLNVRGFYDGLLAQVDRAVDDGFVREVHREFMIVDAEIERMLARMAAYRPPQGAVKWQGAS